MKIARVKHKKMMYSLQKLGVLNEVLHTQRSYYGAASPQIPRDATMEAQPCRVEKPQLQLQEPSQSLSIQSPRVVLPPQKLEEECIKGVILEEVIMSSTLEACPKEEKKDILKSLEEATIKVEINEIISNNHQQESTCEEEVQQDIMVNSHLTCLFEDAQSVESKGEGLLPYTNEDLAHSDIVKHDVVGSDDAHMFKEHFSNDVYFEATSDHLVVTSNSNDRQSLGKSLVYFVDDLEMDDASSLSFQVEGQEMVESSSLKFVRSSHFANSWDLVSEAARDLFKQGSIFECQAIHSLWLFLIQESVLRFEGRFHLETTHFDASYPLLLQPHGEEKLPQNNERSHNVLEDEEDDDWGFDNPTCIIDANMQENIDKAMVRIAGLKGTEAKELEPKDHEGQVKPLANYSTQNQDEGVIPLYDMNTHSMLRGVLQAFEEPFLSFNICMFVVARVYECKFSAMLGFKIQMQVLWEISVRIWDPG